MQKIFTVAVLLLGLKRIRGQRGRVEDIDSAFPTIFRDDALPSRPTKSDRAPEFFDAGDVLPTASRAVVFSEDRRTTTTARPVQNPPVRFPGGSSSNREVPSVPLFITNSAPGFATGGLDEDYEYYYDDPPLPSGPTRQPAVPSQRFGRNSQSSSSSEEEALEAARPMGVDRFTTERSTLSLSSLLSSTRRPRTGPVRVTSQLDTLQQSQLFAAMDPHQEQFIRPPKTNAGSLPLASEI